MSLRSCSDAELAFELALRSKLSAIESSSRSFDVYLDGSLGPLDDDAWSSVQAAVFDTLAECDRQLYRIRKGISESAPGEYDGPSY